MKRGLVAKRLADQVTDPADGAELEPAFYRQSGGRTLGRIVVDPDVVAVSIEAESASDAGSVVTGAPDQRTGALDRAGNGLAVNIQRVNQP